jgi:hypothetical protein
MEPVTSFFYLLIAILFFGNANAEEPILRVFRKKAGHRIGQHRLRYVA